MEGVLCKNILFPGWLGSHHLFEMVQISFTFENSEKVVKSGCFEKPLRWCGPTFFQNEGGI